MISDVCRYSCFPQEDDGVFREGPTRESRQVCRFSSGALLCLTPSLLSGKALTLPRFERVAQLNVILLIERALPVASSASTVTAHNLASPVAEHGDLRDYGIGAQILVDLGIREMILLSNTHSILPGIEGYGLTIVEQKPIRESGE